MIIIAEIILVLVASICSLIYMEKTKVKEKKNIKSIIHLLLNVLKSEKAKMFFVIIQLIAGIGMVVMLNMVYRNNNWIMNLKVITLVMMLFPCAWKDYREYLIPNKILLVGFFLRVVYFIPELVIYKGDFFYILKDNLIGVLVVGVFLIVCSIAVKSGLGMGDIKLFMVMAFYQGLTGVISSMFFSLWISFFVSIVLLIRKRKTKKDKIPFAPFILIGTYISVMLTGI